MFEDPAFWALVGLVVFFGIIIYLKVPAMIGGTLDKRAATIRDELDQARRRRAGGPARRAA